MKKTLAFLSIVFLAVYIHQQNGMIHFIFRLWPVIIVAVSLLAACLALGGRNVLNAFRGSRPETAKRVIQILICTTVLTVILGGARVCQNLANPDAIGPIVMLCLSVVIHTTLIALALVLQGRDIHGAVDLGAPKTADENIH